MKKQLKKIINYILDEKTNQIWNKVKK